MNILEGNNIKLTWCLSYVGLDKNWLSINDVVSNISLDLLDELDGNNLADFYLKADESKNAFQNFIKNVCNITDESYKKCLWIWSVAFLNEALKSNKSKSEVLKDIANIWAMIDYPETWKDFIYYMPVSENVDLGEDNLYARLLIFIKQENNKLEGML